MPSSLSLSLVLYFPDFFYVKTYHQHVLKFLPCKQCHVSNLMVLVNDKQQKDLIVQSNKDGDLIIQPKKKERKKLKGLNCIKSKTWRTRIGVNHPVIVNKRNAKLGAD